LPLRTVKCA